MEGPIVNVTEGSLLGQTNLSPGGIEYYSFTGIPYAEPPIGPLRFKDPMPHGPWSGVKDATKLGNASSQYNTITNKYSGNDDSLFVNVHTPKLNPAILLPVMIYIHGGAFVIGTSGNFNPGFLIEKDVVFASMNYRLSVMGFLCTDPVNARGDMGLKDQNLAIKWVKNNIKHFGGDPENITIFGDSAGSASVEYQMLSEMSKGLFQRAIMESGSAASPWAKSPDPLDTSRRLANKLGYNPESGESVFDFLNSFETEKLITASAYLFNTDDLKLGQYSSFVPAINVFKDNKGFLNDEPKNILKEGKYNMIPTITGFCNDEGLFMKYFYSDDEVWNDLKSGKLLDYIPSSLNKNFEGGEERLIKVYQSNSNGRNKNGYIYDFLSDVGIVGGLFYSISQRLKHSKEGLYLYNFAYEGNMNYFGDIYSKEGDRLYGVPHVEEISYLSANKNTTNADDMAMRNQLVEMWTNFAKTGNPTPDGSAVRWAPTKEDKFQYMQLDKNFKMVNKLEDRKKLWDEIFSNV